MQIDPLYTLSGAVVGFVVGLTGVGGGSLMTPALVLLFGVHPATAVGTDLLFAAITKTAGATVHGCKRNIDWRIVGRLAAGSAPGSAITLFLMDRYGVHTAQMSRTIGVVLGVALVLTALSILLRKQLLALKLRPQPATEATRTVVTIAFGAVLGVVVSISSVGAGAMGLTVLLLLYPSAPIVRIVGADVAHAVPLTFIAGIGHWMIGSVDVSMLASLLIGSVPGVVIGAQLAPGVDERAIRIVLSVMLGIVGMRLIVA